MPWITCFNGHSVVRRQVKPSRAVDRPAQIKAVPASEVVREGTEHATQGKGVRAPTNSEKLAEKKKLSKSLMMQLTNVVEAVAW